MDRKDSTMETLPKQASQNGNDSDNEDKGYQIPKFPGNENLYENILKAEATGSRYKIPENGIESRKLFLLRHGERVDFTFGTWIPYCFDESGKYTRKDLNMPATLPKRSDGPSGYVKDSPLTNIGVFQAKILGEALKEKQINLAGAYSSPSFRCIQTCDAFLKGCNKRDEIKIKIEPGLFEWSFWYSYNVPDWMTPAELVEAGFNIDLNYEPFVTEAELRQSKETCKQFYARNASAAKSALCAHSAGNVLLVGHSSTLDTCSRELIGKKARQANEMTEIIQKMPYCSFIQLEQDGENWEITEPPVPPVTHLANDRFDYKVLLD